MADDLVHENHLHVVDVDDNYAQLNVNEKKKKKSFSVVMI